MSCREDPYRTDALRFQEAYRRFLRDNPNSPVPIVLRPHYVWDSLFFPYNPLYRIVAEVSPLPMSRFYRFEYSDGTADSLRWWGFLLLPWQGDTLRLHLFLTEAGDDSAFFLPFYDATNGQTTYGGGRYLDIPYDTGRLIVDFNLATHPYCAYSDQYSCMAPPSANSLPFPVWAGERIIDPTKHKRQ